VFARKRDKGRADPGECHSFLVKQAVPFMVVDRDVAQNHQFNFSEFFYPNSRGM